MLMLFLISPVTGKKKSGDFKGDFIINCYDRIIRSGSYSPFEVVLSAFSTYSRYAGPNKRYSLQFVERILVVIVL